MRMFKDCRWLSALGGYPEAGYIRELAEEVRRVIILNVRAACEEDHTAEDVFPVASAVSMLCG